MWDSSPRVPDPQTGVLTKLHQYRQNSSCRGNRVRTAEERSSRFLRSGQKSPGCSLITIDIPIYARSLLCRLYAVGIAYCDVLVAMNPAALMANAKWAKPGASIILDLDAFDEAALTK